MIDFSWIDKYSIWLQIIIGTGIGTLCAGFIVLCYFGIIRCFEILRDIFRDMNNR